MTSLQKKIIKSKQTSKKFFFDHKIIFKIFL